MFDDGQTRSNTSPPSSAARSPNGPPCDRCGTITALESFKPHPTLPQHALRTYVCPNCGHREVLGAPVQDQ